MSPSTTAAKYRARFELLERRDLMTADLSINFSCAAFLSSTVGNQSHHNDTELHDVDASTYLRVVFRTAPVAPAPGPAPTAAAKPAPAPVVAPPAPTPPPDWFAVNLGDVALRNVVRASAVDNLLSRQDMLSIFTQVGRDGVVSASEFTDLKTVLNKTSFYNGLDYVRVLSTDVISGSPANLYYQGTTLGNLNAGSSSAQLNKLVDKWFYGGDRPTVLAGATYKQASGTLFVNGPQYTDVRQGAVGDCYYLASLAETALRTPATITNMFIVNGDGTYTVRFNKYGTWDYVTVDSKLPVDSRGNFVYANYGQSASNPGNELWVALAEKAYAQVNEARWLRTDPSSIGRNSYAALAGGYMFEALNQITAKPAGYNVVDVATFTSLYNAGKLITFGSVGNARDGVVGNHAYAVVSYDKTKQLVTLFNPWGINNGSAPGLVTLTWAQMKSDFASMQYA